MGPILLSDLKSQWEDFASVMEFLCVVQSDIVAYSRNEDGKAAPKLSEFVKLPPDTFETTHSSPKVPLLQSEAGSCLSGLTQFVTNEPFTSQDINQALYMQITHVSDILGIQVHISPGSDR